MNRDTPAGLAFALSAYVIWGLFPLYWKQLEGVDALEILAHRILWTLPAAAAVLTVIRGWGPVGRVLGDARTLALLGLTALLIAVNWGVYIWAVTHERILEASLGYFLTPLVTVLLGIVLFEERLRLWQWLAVALAAAGVLNLLRAEGGIPWVGLTLACSFATYGALRKKAVVESAAGLLLEAAWLALPALGWVIWLSLEDEGRFLAGDPATDALLLGAGVMTAVPLLLYVAGARRLRLATLGLLFYLNPTLQFLVGVLVYDEPLSRLRLLTFALIWTALLLYVVEGRLQSGRTP